MVHAELRDLLALAPNWDSYGAPVIDAAVAKKVAVILNVLAQEGQPRPGLVPTSVGGIQIEWYTNRIELQLELEPPSPNNS